MARPSKNNADFFGHDHDMRNHRKIKAIRTKFGITGYAIWCMFLEVLTESEENRFNDNDLEIELLAGDFGVSVTEIRELLDFCIRLELLYSESNRIYSKTLDEKLKSVYEKRDLARKNYENKLNNKTSTTSKGVSVTEMTQSKGKVKGKVKEIINIEFSVFWDLYGNKKDTKNSEAKWKLLTDDERRLIIEDIPKYIKSLSDRKFQKYPLTYLNGKCWLDEHGTPENQQNEIKNGYNSDLHPNSPLGKRIIV